MFSRLSDGDLLPGDVTLVASDASGTSTQHVHRVFMAAESKMLERMFSNSFREGESMRDTTAARIELNLPDGTINVFTDVVRWCYNRSLDQEFENLSVPNVVQLYCLADYMEMPSLLREIGRLAESKCVETPLPFLLEIYRAHSTERPVSGLFDSVLPFIIQSERTNFGCEFDKIVDDQTNQTESDFSHRILQVLAPYLPDLPYRDFNIHEFAFLCSFVPAGCITENALCEIVLDYAELHCDATRAMQLLQVVDLTQISPDFLTCRLLRSAIFIGHDELQSAIQAKADAAGAWFPVHCPVARTMLEPGEIFASTCGHNFQQDVVDSWRCYGTKQPSLAGCCLVNGCFVPRKRSPAVERLVSARVKNYKANKALGSVMLRTQLLGWQSDEIEEQGKESALDSGDDEEAVAQPPPAKRAKGAGFSGAAWQCVSCTFQNPAGTEKCDMCDMRKPPVSGYEGEISVRVQPFTEEGPSGLCVCHVLPGDTLASAFGHVCGEFKPPDGWSPGALLFVAKTSQSSYPCRLADIKYEGGHRLFDRHNQEISTTISQAGIEHNDTVICSLFGINLSTSDPWR